MIIPHGNVNDKKLNVLPAMTFEIIRQAVKTPVKVAYNSTFVELPNMFNIIYSMINKFHKQKS